MQIPHRNFSLGTRGFTMVEMMIAVSIFAIITTIVLVKNSQFNSTVLLSSLAYDVALSVREAQVFGLSVREDVDGSGGALGLDMVCGFQ